MKKFVLAVLLAVMLAIPLASPAAAASTCGDSYVIQKGDILASIADKCGVTIDYILARNPQITNSHWIYYGQTLRLSGDPVYYPPVYTGTPYTVQWGDTLKKIADRYGISWLDIARINPQIWDPSLIFAGTTILLPNGVVVTDPTNGCYTYVNNNCSSNGYNNGSAYTRLSATAVKPGGAVTITAFGFPPNADIDFRMGKTGASYSVVIDGKTDANGSATTAMTVPAEAVVNDHWSILVTTTGMKDGVEVTSADIVIIP